MLFGSLDWTPYSDDTWITSDDLQQIDKDLFEYYKSRLALHSMESIFFTLGELVGTPDPDLLLAVSMAADPRKLIRCHYGLFISILFGFMLFGPTLFGLVCLLF